MTSWCCQSPKTSSTCSCPILSFTENAKESDGNHPFPTKNLRAELGWFSALPPLTVDELRLVWWKASQFPPLAFGLFLPYLFFPLLGCWHFPSAGGFPLAYKYAIIAHVKQTLPCLLVPLVLFFLVPLHRIPQEKFSILLLGPPHCTPTPEKLFLFRPLTANIF